MQYTVLPLNIMSSETSMLLTISEVCSFTVEQHSIIWSYYSFLIPSLIDWGRFQFEAIMIKLGPYISFV